ncbi:DUF6194 family protein [Rhodococcus sp. NPDC127528]|uniref:DUF6194 family protein n=1 Tax=unclassified Rhodococcus (in: high G+C Gram-positive bacteria) TaxID=192944 RepID=UPI003635B897
MTAAEFTETEIIESARALPGVVATTANAENGAPEAAWGDSFFFYDPDDDTPADRRLPFATIVTNDVAGWDTSSRLSRPGVFRLNIAVGRDRFRELLGYPPAAVTERSTGIDYSALDELLPHPTYAAQSWVSILNPSRASAPRVRALLTDAHARAVARHRPRS